MKGKGRASICALLAAAPLLGLRLQRKPASVPRFGKERQSAATRWHVQASSKPTAPGSGPLQHPVPVTRMQSGSRARGRTRTGIRGQSQAGKGGWLRSGQLCPRSCRSRASAGVAQCLLKKIRSRAIKKLALLGQQGHQRCQTQREETEARACCAHRRRCEFSHRCHLTRAQPFL